jgi:hypothetical protein
MTPFRTHSSIVSVSAPIWKASSDLVIKSGSVGLCFAAFTALAHFPPAFLLADAGLSTGTSSMARYYPIENTTFRRTSLRASSICFRIFSNPSRDGLS